MTRAWLAGIGWLVVACEPGADPQAIEPRVIEGGGAADGPIAGTLNVFAVIGMTGAPVAGATVSVGDLVGTTDQDGLVIFSDTGLVGAQRIDVVAETLVATTWIGVAGANVTIPMEVPYRGPSGTDPPRGQVSGTLEGWEAWPDPPVDWIRYARIECTQTADPGDPEYPFGGAGEDLCFAGAPCTYSIATRTGTVGVYAIIHETNGGTTRIVGIAYAGGLEVIEDEELTDVTLVPVPSSALEAFSAVLPAGPEELAAEMQVRIDLGADGVMPFPYYTAVRPGDIGSEDQLIPSRAAFPDAVYQVDAYQPGKDAALDVDGGTQTTIHLRGLTSVLDATYPEFLPYPARLDPTDDVVELEPAAGAGAHMLVDRSSSDLRPLAWRALVLDDTTEVMRPEGATPSAGGMTDLIGLDVVVDPADFRLAEILEVARHSRRQASPR